MKIGRIDLETRRITFEDADGLRYRIGGDDEPGAKIVPIAFNRTFMEDKYYLIRSPGVPDAIVNAVIENYARNEHAAHFCLENAERTVTPVKLVSIEF